MTGHVDCFGSISGSSLRETEAAVMLFGPYLRGTKPLKLTLGTVNREEFELGSWKTALVTFVLKCRFIRNHFLIQVEEIEAEVMSQASGGEGAEGEETERQQSIIPSFSIFGMRLSWQRGLGLGRGGVIPRRRGWRLLAFREERGLLLLRGLFRCGCCTAKVVDGGGVAVVAPAWRCPIARNEEGQFAEAASRFVPTERGRKHSPPCLFSLWSSPPSRRPRANWTGHSDALFVWWPQVLRRRKCCRPPQARLLARVARMPLMPLLAKSRSPLRMPWDRAGGGPAWRLDRCASRGPRPASQHLSAWSGLVCFWQRLSVFAPVVSAVWAERAASARSQASGWVGPG